MKCLQCYNQPLPTSPGGRRKASVQNFGLFYEIEELAYVWIKEQKMKCLITNEQ